VFSGKVLIIEGSPIDRITTSAIAIGDISTLDGETTDHAMKFAVLVG
jgi:hypothetical protein